MYATPQSLLERFDAQELAQVAVPKQHVSIDAILLELTISGGDRSAYTADEVAAADAALAKINRALSDATGDINSNLDGRATLPLAVVPPNLERICCDLARFYLHDDHATEEIIKRYDMGVEFLTNVAKGKISLGLNDEGARPETANTVQFNGGSNVFDRDKSKDFI